MIKFEFPTKVKKFLKKEKIKIKDIKYRLNVKEDLLDKNYKEIKYKELKVVINGISKWKGNKIYISSNKISKKKPFTKKTHIAEDYSVYYLIFIKK